MKRLNFILLATFLTLGTISYGALAQASPIQRYKESRTNTSVQSSAAITPANEVDQRMAVYGQSASMDTKPVYFDMGSFKYKIPRNYIIDMGGGLVTIKATFPGFEPLSEKTKDCLTKPYLYLPKGCFPVTFWIRVGKIFGDSSKKISINGKTITDADEWHFNNRRKLFHSQIPKKSPYGFEMYETGPDNARIETYRKKTPLHTLLITCMKGAFLSPTDPNGAICDNLHSTLPQGGDVSYRIRFDQMKDVEKIDTGIRELLNSFIIREEKQ